MYWSKGPALHDCEGECYIVTCNKVDFRYLTVTEIGLTRAVAGVVFVMSGERKQGKKGTPT